MNRRHFLFSTAAAAVPKARAASTTISKITLAPAEGRFHKFVAMNSYDKVPKGHTYSNTLVRIQTSQGVEGVGVMGYAAPDPDFEQKLKTLIGADPLTIYRMDAGRIVGRNPQFEALLTKHRHLDGPLFDLIGKLTNKPAWRLLGDSIRDRIECYDGTLYFSDVWFKDRGVTAVVEEVLEAQRSGYGGVKLKLGRGSKWMEKEAGIKRDIEVVKAVRAAAGPELLIMCDPNNGYRNDRDNAWRLLNETAAANMYWIEEIFPESVPDYTWLRDRMEKAGMKTLIADGESVDQAEVFEPYLKPRRLMDVIQPDIRRFGFLDNWKAAQMAAAAGAFSIPHNWGAQMGLHMALHLAKVAKAIPRCEDDRSTLDVVISDGYRFANGTWTVPDKPGLALSIDESVYKLKCKGTETVIA